MWRDTATKTKMVLSGRIGLKMIEDIKISQFDLYCNINNNDDDMLLEWCLNGQIWLFLLILQNINICHKLLVNNIGLNISK